MRIVESCLKNVDLSIQHHLEISSLVWAGMGFILPVGLNSRIFLVWVDAHIY